VAKDLIPRVYQRGLRPSINDPDGTYLEEELRRIEETLREVLDTLPQVAYKAPQSPRNSMIRYAKAPWDPLGTGDGWVYYDEGAWKAL